MSEAFELPPLILLKDYEGSWSDYFTAIYQQFRCDFVTSKPEFLGRPFGLKCHPLYEGKEATFWHCISEGKVESERLPDLRRCERMSWIKPMITAVPSPNVHCWVTQRNNDKRIVLALTDFSYVMILADRGNYLLLWTAYCVERDHQRRKLSEDFQSSSQKL